MNTESLALLRDYFIEPQSNIFENKDIIFEAKGHMDHPEDLVLLNGVEGTRKALASMQATIKNPVDITTKFDGYPALIFGKGPDGKFSIMDKHMFNRTDGKGRQIYSPQDFIRYDNDRGVIRTELHKIISELWKPLAKAYIEKNGYYWGDLLFSKKLQQHDSVYTFRPNPNGISYNVTVDSELGRFLNNKIGGIVVHQHIDAYAKGTDDAESLNGTIGRLQNNDGVAILPAALPIKPIIKKSSKLENNVIREIRKWENPVDEMYKNAPYAMPTFTGLFTVYINKKIVADELDSIGSDFVTFLQSRKMSAKQLSTLIDYFNNHKNGLIGLFNLWVAVYKLKMHIYNQLAEAAKQSPIQGYLQDGTPTQEGFVSNGLKYVDRTGFSRQNLAGRN